METPGSFPGIGTEVYDYGYDRDEPVIFVEAGEIFSGCGGTLFCFSVVVSHVIFGDGILYTHRFHHLRSCYVIRAILSSDPFSGKHSLLLSLLERGFCEKASELRR